MSKMSCFSCCLGLDHLRVPTDLVGTRILFVMSLTAFFSMSLRGSFVGLDLDMYMFYVFVYVNGVRICTYMHMCICAYYIRVRFFFALRWYTKHRVVSPTQNKL